MATTYTLNGQPLDYGPVSVGYGDDTVNYPAQILDLWSDAQLATLGIVRTADPAPPDPPAPGLRTCSVYDLMYGRVTQPERLDIRASTDPVVIDFLGALQVIPQVELDGPLTVAGIHYMESVNLLAPGRAVQILA